MKEIRNAKIASTMLGYEDHGIMTCMITVDYGGSMQGFGGYGFDEYDETSQHRKGTAYGLAFIMRILDVLEIGSWEKLKGVHCRVDSGHGKVYGLGHILKDQWFYPNVDLQDYLKED